MRPRGLMEAQELLVVLAGLLAVGLLGVAMLAVRLRARARAAESAAAHQERTLETLARVAGEAASHPHRSAAAAVAALEGLGLVQAAFLVHDEPSGRWVDRAVASETPSVAGEDVAAAAARCWERQEPVVTGSAAAPEGEVVACPVPSEAGVRAVLVAARPGGMVDRADIAAVGTAAGLLGSVRAPVVGAPSDRDASEPRAAGPVDSLTGLGTPQWFSAALEARCRADETAPVALLLVAVDGVEDVAEVLGWRAGEEVVRIAARRLHRCVRPDDQLARLEPSMFGVLLTDAADPDGAATVGARALAALKSPVAVTGGEVRVAGRASVLWDASGCPDPAALLGESREALAGADGEVASVLRFSETEASARGQAR